MQRLLTVLTPAILMCSCAHVSERHFFRQVNPAGETVNYVRLRVSGGAGLSSARYLAGCFDEGAVNAYFGEISQPEKAAFPGGHATDDGAVKTVGRCTSTQSLVLLMSSNSDAVATQIGNLAQSQQTASTLATLAARDRLKGARQDTIRLEVEREQDKLLAQLGEDLILGLDPTVPAEVNKNLLAYFNALAAGLGHAESFSTLAQGAKWFEENRNRLMETRP